MVFSSIIFLWIFLPLVFLLDCIIKSKYSNILLFISSIIFYAWGEIEYLHVMLIVILLSYYIAKIMYDDKKYAKMALIFGICSDLVVLFFFKYRGFAAGIVNKLLGTSLFAEDEVYLPIGISFYIFQSISFMIDVYRDGEERKKPQFLQTALYISFFPQLIAGPIVKYKDIKEQIVSRKKTLDDFSKGFRRFIYGLAKKVLISNCLAVCVDYIYDCDISQIGGKTAWLVTICYTFQIYYDFSGYSDMAVGLGLMFGLKIPENFKYPYLSKSISEFWRRWHITLGAWFKEYIYIPLGGSKVGNIKTYRNLLIVFFLTGLWHGANYNFVIWGMIHGVFIIFERLCLSKCLERHRFISVLYCFFVVNLGWVFFRVQKLDTAVEIAKRMIAPWLYSDNRSVYLLCLDKKVIFILVIAVIGSGILKYIIPEKIKFKWKYSSMEAVYCFVLLFLCIANIATGTYNPFIYFNF